MTDDKLQREVDAMLQSTSENLGVPLDQITFSYDCYYCEQASDAPVCQACLDAGKPNGYWNEYKDFVTE